MSGLTAAEQKLLNYLEGGIEESEDFRNFCDCALEFQSVVGYVEGVGSLLSTMKIELSKIIEERTALQAQISKLQSDAGWAAEAERERAAIADHSTWK